ncbi:segregation and condensation protein A [Streptomyces sp. MH60]|uniref:segregation and condensation protein A n=1 Tax=Streptomyces sp. MH60 TaxID=1940758 RepID=UPI000D463DFF|nr:segregation/condensation protein A [Streptomyces sp. MH60]PPS79793.1 Segregation and condensation protein A [Streptomyces sp. MH60]
MTSNDAPHPGRGPRAARRRALGRGPEAPTAAPLPEERLPATGPSPVAAPEDVERHARGESAPAAPAGAPDAGPGDPARVRETTDPDAEGRDHPGRSDTGTPATDPGSVDPGTRPEPTGARAGGPLRSAPAVEPPPVPAQRPGDADREGSGRPGGPPPQEPPKDVPDDGGDGVFKVRLANFEGPFDLLLQLISKHKMDVTEVALSKVTDEFMAHIRAMGPDWDLDQTTEFLVVAATLLDLKAARLLPAAEVEDEADLALLEARDLLFARLLQYRAYKQIAEIFNERLEAEARRYPRTVGLEPHHAELLPEVVISIGPEGFAKLAVKAMQPKPKPQVYVEHIHAPLVSVQEQAGIVVARLKELGEASFRVLVQDTEDTLTVVARFLALLELYREKAVELDQETALGDLLVRWTGGDGKTQPVVTDEFDRPPEVPKEEQKA